MDILITGVAGLLGSRMAEWVVKNKPEFNVIGIDNLSGGCKEFIPAEVEFYRADLTECNLDKLLGDRDVQYVYHFAAYAAEGLSPFIRKYNYNNNLISTANVVNYCISKDIDRLVFASSMAVYGKGQTPFDEDHLPSPIDPYGIAKYACEMDIKVANEQHGLEYCIIRPHNVYGINQNIWDRYRNVLGIWMYQKLNGLPITIFGEGSQKRAFSYIEDSLEPLWQAAVSNKSKNQVINLGGVDEVKIVDAAKIFENIVEGVEIRFLPSRHEVKNAFSTHQKSVDILGYQDKTPLKDGIQEMWNWAKNQPRRDRFEWDSYEIEKGLYSFWKN